MNLNSSFLGIAFETQTRIGEDLPSANAAQIHAARTLTEMLRSKYHIARVELRHARAGVGESRQHADRLSHRLGR